MLVWRQQDDQRVIMGISVCERGSNIAILPSYYYSVMDYYSHSPLIRLHDTESSSITSNIFNISNPTGKLSANTQIFRRIF